ncbi:uncharacterized protein LOC105213715 [Zeugodacus cucurbitae]|uniref:Probable carboxypeptidase UREG_07869 n=1 Tax=Zeugodacus cucurbitae TaxID=28588 RepID=A0A0A1WF06_ZEUCU|nr:uncharacterized protein LOC105213715 [Zeugodacus cucurbitae]
MYQRVALIGLLAIVPWLLLANAAEIRQEQLEDDKNVIVKVVTPEEMDKILAQNPNAVELKATRAEIQGRYLQPQGRSIITYTLGESRQDGDRLVASDSSTNDYDVPTTLTVTMRYPSAGAGPGAVVTFVKIQTYQSNNDGRAYATSGGIGQRTIVVAIEAHRTTYFDFFSWVYGK